jgi:hypothetical protein
LHLATSDFLPRPLPDPLFGNLRITETQVEITVLLYPRATGVADGSPGHSLGFTEGWFAIRTMICTPFFPVIPWDPKRMK